METCCAVKKVTVGLTFIHGKEGYRCGNKAKYFEKGRWYCGKHAPSKVKEREDAAFSRTVDRLRANIPKEDGPFISGVSDVEVFSIKNGEAFIGFKNNSGFQFIQVPYTEPSKHTEVSNLKENYGKWMLSNFGGLNIEKMMFGDVEKQLEAARKENPGYSVRFNRSTGIIELTKEGVDMVPIEPMTPLEMAYEETIRDAERMMWKLYSMISDKVSEDELVEIRKEINRISGVNAT